MAPHTPHTVSEAGLTNIMLDNRNAALLAAAVTLIVQVLPYYSGNNRDRLEQTINILSEESELTIRQARLTAGLKP